MWFRLTRSEFAGRKGAGNKAAMRRLVMRGETLGILAYAGKEAVGWCAVAPRETYPALERSPAVKRLDDRPVWSITCFFVAKPWRRRGVSEALVRGALDFARKKKARLVEAYPKAPSGKDEPASSAYHGFPSVFRKAGFRMAAARIPSRPIMRKPLE